METHEDPFKKEHPHFWNSDNFTLKLLAGALFIALPFLGGWIGYNQASQYPQPIPESFGRVQEDTNVGSVDIQSGNANINVIFEVETQTVSMSIEPFSDRKLVFGVINPYALTEPIDLPSQLVLNGKTGEMSLAGQFSAVDPLLKIHRATKDLSPEAAVRNLIFEQFTDEKRNELKAVTSILTDDQQRLDLGELCELKEYPGNYYALEYIEESIKGLDTSYRAPCIDNTYHYFSDGGLIIETIDFPYKQERLVEVESFGIRLE